MSRNRSSLGSKLMRRRQFINLLGATMTWPLAARARQDRSGRRIGVLIPFTATDAEAKRYMAALRQGLRELGWAEGRDVGLEVRYLNGQLDRTTAVVSELMGLDVEILVTEGSQVVQAAREVTGTIPIIFARVGDAVGAKFAASLARPGGNLTGLSLYATEQGEKRLEILSEILPGLTKAAMLWNSKNASQRLQAKKIEAAATVLTIELRSFAVPECGDFEVCVHEAAQTGAQALITLDDALIQSHRAQIIGLALQRKLPVVGEFRASVDAGALMSYSADAGAMWHRAASFVDRILRGAKPSELPVELPTQFQLIVNLKTARELGINVPAAILARADEVIE